MRIKPLVMMLGLLLSTAYAGRSDREAIYASLETFAELLSVVAAHSPTPVEQTDMVTGAIDGLLGQLDPHSSYYDADHYQTMKEDQRGAFYGIGIMVGYQDRKLTVVSPMAGGPAALVGIRAGDVILKINDVSTKDMDIYQAIRLLRGEEGTLVRVTVRRLDVEEALDFEIRRAEIPSNNVRASFMLDADTGYVALKDFGENAGVELREAILALEKQDMKRMILDLRGNPGGLLPRAIEVSGLFLPGHKLVVTTKGRTRNSSKNYHSQKTSPIQTLPLIVLIDRGSASASEIVAGAIQDHDRGLIVGVNSWGKGLVQSVYPLADGERGLALTTSRYYTPSGRNIQGDFHSLEAYFNPKSSEDQYFSPDDKAELYKTRHGREVRAVRGITPDVYIAYKRSPKPLRDLAHTHGAFFNFAAEHQEAYGNPTPQWRADDALVERFLDWLAGKEIATAALGPYRDEIADKLTYQFQYIKDPDQGWRSLMTTDRHVLAAKELFGPAEELLRVHDGTGKLAPDYAKRLMQFAKLRKAEETSSP